MVKKGGSYIMSFPVYFKYNNEPMNKINKDVSATLYTLTGTLRDGCSVVSPEIMVEYENPLDANYAYIPVFRRYYYINDIQAYRSYRDEHNLLHNLWLCKMHCDVLRTFAEGIMGSPCIVAKTGGDDFNLYLPDPNFKRQQNDLHGLVKFPNGFPETLNSDSVRYYLTFFG